MPFRRRAASDDRVRFELVDEPVDEPAEDRVPAEVAGDHGAEGSAEEGDTGERGRPGDAHGADDVGEQPGPHQPPAEGDRARTRGRRRATVALVTAGAVVLAGMAVVDEVSARRSLERLRSVPGGVASAADPPAVQWEHEVEPGTEGLTFVVDAYVFTVAQEVAAYDLGTGQERWRVAFDDPVSCGPLGWAGGSSPAEDPLVCLSGPRQTLPVIPRPQPGEIDPVTVTVLDRHGTVVAERDVHRPPDVGLEGPVAWTPPAAGPRGGVLRFARVGPEPDGQGDPVDVDPETRMLTGSGEPRDGVVTLEDAATGEVRWQRPLEVGAIEPGTCVGWTTSGSPDDATVDLDAGRAWYVDGVVQVRGCGIEATFAPDGTRLDDPDRTGELVVPFEDHYLRDPAGTVLYGDAPMLDDSGAPRTSTLVDAAGDVVWEAPGLVLPAQATDGRSALRFVVEDEALSAYGADHRRVWSAELAAVPDRVLVATRDAVLVATRGDGLAGLDARTGHVRWTGAAGREPDGADGVTGLPPAREVERAFTDGGVALLVVRGGSRTGRSSLLGVDLGSGRVLWTAGTDAGAWAHMAVDGRLLRLSETSLVRLG